MNDFTPAAIAEIEKQRLSYFRGRKPAFLLPLPASTQARLRAIQLFHQGKLEIGVEKLDEANESADAFEGTVDGREIGGWRDEDDLLGDTLELVIAGKAHWLPMTQVQSLKLTEKSSLVCEFYLPVELRLINREAVMGWLPIRYVQSLEHPEPEIQTAQEVDLYGDAAGCTRCLGLRSWRIGLDEFSPWEFRQIEKSGRIGLA